MPVVYNKCCICIGLRKGSLIIGYVNLLVLIAVLTATIYNIATEDSSAPGHSIYNSQKLSWTFSLPSYVILAAIIFLLLFTILLLIAVHGSKRRLMKIYLMFHAIFIIVYTIGFIVRLASDGISIIVTDLGVICVTLNCFMVLRSYYIVTEQEITRDIECDSTQGVLTT